MIPKRTYKTMLISSFLWCVTALPLVVSGVHALESDAQENPYPSQDNGRFFIQRPQVGMGLSAKMEEEKRRGQNTETTTTEYEFRENITVSTNGWVYHPNLMKFRLSFTPQWQQETFDTSRSPSLPTQSDQSGNATILTFDAATTLLNDKPVSINLFANRKAEQIDFSNVRDSDIESQRYGARLNYTNPVLPASLSFLHQRLDESGFYRSSEDRTEARLIVQHLAAKSVSRLSLVHDTVEEIYTTVNESNARLRTTSAEITNAFFITDDHGGVKLDSRIYGMHSEYNSLDYDVRQVSENLVWPHTKNLLTRYYAGYSDRQFGSSGHTETRLGAGLTHLFRDRLTTTFDTAAVMSAFTDGGENLYYADLDLRYRRPFPWGSIELGAACDYAVANRRGGQNIIPTELQLTLRTGVDAYLDQADVITESIIVTDITGAVAYSPDIDYTIDTIGSNVRISRTLTGAIADGQQVLVRYNYSLDAGFDDSRLGQTYQVHLNLWSSFFLTYNHNRLKQTINSGMAPSVPRDDVTNAIRLGFVSKWSETRWLYQKQDRSNGNSEDTHSLEQHFNFRPAQFFFLNFSGSVGTRDYLETDEDEQFYSLGARIGWTPKWWCRISLNTLRNAISCNGKEALDSQIAVMIKLTYGLWTASASYRLRDQNNPDMNNSLWRQEVLITFNRRLW